MDSRSVSKSRDFDQQPDLISIPQLSPDLRDVDRYSFQAVVTLVWPFSSSNRLFSLLLAERDFRLRNQNGQIRVTFCGLCAKEVALTKVGIGDTVTLSLQGAQWTENKDIQSTPGKSLSWELRFKNRLKFEATRNGEKIAALDIDRPLSPSENIEPPSPVQLNDGFATPDRYQERWETPAFLRTKRIISRSPLYSELNPFAEEDGYIPGKGRKRPRFSFPSSEWRLVDEPDNFAEEPLKDNDDWFESDEEELGHEDEEGGIATGAARGTEEYMATISNTIPASAVLSGDMQLAGFETPAYTMYRTVQAITPSLEETVVQYPVQNTSLSSETPQLGHLTSTDPATPSPRVSTPAEDLRHPYGLHSNSILTDFLGDHEHSDITPDTYNLEPQERVKMHSTNTQVQSAAITDFESNLPSQYTEQTTTTTTAISRHGSSRQCSPFAAASELSVLHTEQTNASSTGSPHQLETPGYHATNKEDTPREEVQIVESAPAERPRIYEMAIDAERLKDMQEIDEYEGNEPKESGEHLPGQPNLDAERGADHSPHASGSEDMVSEETRANLQKSEAESLVHGSYRNVNGDTKNDEVELDDTDLSDDAEEGSEEITSVEFESDIPESEVESDRESYDGPVSEPDIPQQNARPEVIVIDSDSDDEPPPTNAHPAMQERIASHTSGTLSYIHDNDAYQYNEYMQEESDEFSDAKDQPEERDADAIQSDDDPYDYEHHSHEELPVDDAYLSNEETSFSSNIREAGDHDTYFGDRREFPSEQSGVDSSYQLPGGGEGQDTVRSDMARTGSPLDASSARLTPDNTLKVNGEQIQTRCQGDEAVFSKGDETDALVKKDRSLHLGEQALDQEPYQSSTRNTQRLVYRTATPKPVPTPPSTLDDEPLYRISDTEMHVSADRGSPASASNDVGLENPVDTPHHRWTDGLDEGSWRPDIPSLDKELSTHDITGEDNDALEKLDEVVLVNNYSMQGSPDARRQGQNPEKQDGLPVRESRVYPALATLVEWLDKIIDTISVVVDISPAETAMSGEYRTSLRITDISMAGTTIVVDMAQPYATSISAITEGDIIMLHNFEVQSLGGSLKLLSVDDSDWVVFHDVADKPRVANPMVTFGEHEHVYAETLQNWYLEHGAAMAADHMLQLSISQEDQQPSPFTASSSDAGDSVDSRASRSVSRPRVRRKKSYRRITIHELRDGRRYTDAGTQGSDLIHELRDGTVYAHSFGDT